MVYMQALVSERGLGSFHVSYVVSLLPIELFSNSWNSSAVLSIVEDK